MITHRKFAFDAVTELAVCGVFSDRDCIMYWKVGFQADAVWFKVTTPDLMGLFNIILLVFSLCEEI